MNIRIDRELCTGCADCADNEPVVFELDDGGIATVGDRKGVPEDKVLDVARRCLTNAIIVEDDQGNVIYPVDEQPRRSPARKR